MFQKLETEKYLWGWRWPIIIVVVLLLLLALQMLRVNQRPAAVTTQKPITYSTPGILIADDIFVSEHDFHARQIDLNKRTALFGSFMTSNIKSRVSVLVLDQSNFEKWKLSSSYNPISETGYVPGGKVTPVLEPGTYFVVIDNRANELPQQVRAEFRLE